MAMSVSEFSLNCSSGISGEDLRQHGESPENSEAAERIKRSTSRPLIQKWSGKINSTV
jgi:hypothetical protein